MRRMVRDFIKYSIAGQWINRIRLHKHRIQWILGNKENETIPVSRFNPNIVSVGKWSYGELNVVSFGEETQLKIGNCVSISENVTFLLDVEHYTDRFSTYPFLVKLLRECKYEAFSKGDIIVDDDVWIGYGATIMSGVHIGRGAVIASGAVVTNDVPAYAIVGGVPAKIIKFRFPPEVIEILMNADFKSLTKEIIKNNKELLYEQVDIMNASQIIDKVTSEE